MIKKTINITIEKVKPDSTRLIVFPAPRKFLENDKSSYTNTEPNQPLSKISSLNCGDEFITVYNLKFNNKAVLLAELEE